MSLLEEEENWLKTAKSTDRTPEAFFLAFSITEKQAGHRRYGSVLERCTSGSDRQRLKEEFEYWKTSRGVSFWTDQQARVSAIKTAGSLISASEPYAEDSLRRASKVANASQAESTKTSNTTQDIIESSACSFERGNASTHSSKRRKNISAVDETMKLFEDSPLFDYFAYIFKKAQGSRHNPLPKVPSAEISPNIRRLALYAHSELSKSNTSEQELKNLYTVLSCIVSVHIPNASEVFGMGLILKIKNEINLEQFERSRIDSFLSQLRETYSRSLDVKLLMDEILLRLANIVHQERDGREVIKETLELERVTLEIIRYFCILIVGKQFEHRLSETTCVSYWNYVWAILFGGTDLVFDMGELASSSTKADMQAIEILFGSLSQTGGRKADTLVRVQQLTTGVGTLHECAVNEHKPLHASPSALSHQSSKLLRINRSILGQMGSTDTIVFIDAHGLAGTIYGMKAIDDIFGARALGTIALPTNKHELLDFLQGDSLTMLFRYKVFVTGSPW